MAARKHDARWHVAQIDEWMNDVIADNGEATADEAYSDVVHAYLDSEVSDALMRLDVLRATGVGERGDSITTQLADDIIAGDISFTDAVRGLLR